MTCHGLKNMINVTQIGFHKDIIRYNNIYKFIEQKKIRNRKYTTKQDLQIAIMEEWGQISKFTCKKLIESLSKRIVEIIK